MNLTPKASNKARSMQVWTVISLNSLLSTKQSLVKGVTVSGGQKQRISIARALVKDAPILILDDSVSAVDTNTEKTILSNLETLRKGKTTILIAHRVSTIQNMDKIVFVDDGKVLDVGSHDELYARCEEYRKAVELQRLEDERKEENYA